MKVNWKNPENALRLEQLVRAAVNARQRDRYCRATRRLDGQHLAVQGIGDKDTDAAILAGHFAATRQRFDAAIEQNGGSVLVLHGTTEFSFTREHAEAVGLTH